MGGYGGMMGGAVTTSSGGYSGMMSGFVNGRYRKLHGSYDGRLQWNHRLHGKHDAQRLWQPYFLVQSVHVQVLRVGFIIGEVCFIFR